MVAKSLILPLHLKDIKWFFSSVSVVWWEETYSASLLIYTSILCAPLVEKKIPLHFQTYNETYSFNIFDVQFFIVQNWHFGEQLISAPASFL